MTLFKRHTYTSPSVNAGLKRAALALLVAASLTGLVTAQGLYEEGQRHLDNKDYQAAQDIFSTLAQSDDERRDAALYWLAYSQFKNRRDQAAIKTLDQLSDNYPDSRWLDDAQALKVEIRDSRGESVDIDDEEMKLYALNSLMNSPSEKSVGILQKILTGNSSDRVKQRALFVLSQLNDPQAFDAVATLAKDDSNPELQSQAVKVLGISGSPRAMQLLSEVYQATADHEVKARVLKSFMVANQSSQLVALAKSETDPELKRQAIRLIGVMSEPAILLDMYRDATFRDFREELIQGMAIGGDVDALIEVINTEQEEVYVVEAVQKMGIIGARKTSAHLTGIYANHNSQAVRSAVIQALFIQSNAQGLITIVKTENDPQLKRSALQKLSMMGSDEALDYFNSILDEG